MKFVHNLQCYARFIIKDSFEMMWNVNVVLYFQAVQVLAFRL